MATTEQSSGFGEGPAEEMIRRTAREIAAEYDDEYWREVNHEGTEPDAFWQDCADAGFLGAAVPEEYGGEGMGIGAMTTVVEALEEHGCMGAGMLFVVTPVFGSITLARNGTDAQREQYLEPLVEGDMKFCMALTEPGAGQNTRNLATDAEPTGDGYVVNGAKQWISGVGRADKMLLIARTTPLEEVERPTGGISLFLADPADDGVEC